VKFPIYAGLITGLAAVVLPGAIAPEDPEALFQRIKTRMAEHLAQLPNYTCHQTIDRLLRRGSDFRHLDTVKLEVAFVGQRELFSRPGTDRFGEQPIEKIVSGGTIGNSALGSHIDIIFSRNVGEFKYAGAGRKDGRTTYRFDLHVPVEASTFRVWHAGTHGIAGYDGSVWVDAETLDLVRVDFKVNRIPAHVGVRLIEESLHYKKLMIGKTEFDLPSRSELSATDDMGNVSLNMIKLDRCREFAGEAVVKYGPVSEGTASREPQDH
jgi:hypothetical protein